MGTRVPGEFRPPRELVAVSAPRLSGRGVLVVSSSGLTVEGDLVDVAPPIPWWRLGVPVVAVAVAFAFRSDNPGQILGPVVMAALLLYFWSRFRAEFGQSGAFEVPWSAIEHVVRLPADPEVLGFVLAGPIGRAGTPEQVFFAPVAGVESLAAAILEAAPSSLSVDLESANEHDFGEGDGSTE